MTKRTYYQNSVIRKKISNAINDQLLKMQELDFLSQENLLF